VKCFDTLVYLGGINLVLLSVWKLIEKVHYIFGVIVV
jgi:hypothetical protein